MVPVSPGGFGIGTVDGAADVHGNDAGPGVPGPVSHVARAVLEGRPFGQAHGRVDRKRPLS